MLGGVMRGFHQPPPDADACNQAARGQYGVDVFAVDEFEPVVVEPGRGEFPRYLVDARAGVGADPGHPAARRLRLDADQRRERPQRGGEDRLRLLARAFAAYRERYCRYWMACRKARQNLLSASPSIFLPPRSRASPALTTDLSPTCYGMY
jgi:hypothetical protein